MDNYNPYKKNINRMISRLKNIKNHIVRDEKQFEILSKCEVSKTIINDDYVLEQEKKLNIIENCDVLVVGGGPAGISAAIAASRTCVKTLIIERYGCLGGVITTVGMETIGWYREGTIDSEGIELRWRD